MQRRRARCPAVCCIFSLPESEAPPYLFACLPLNRRYWLLACRTFIRECACIGFRMFSKFRFIPQGAFTATYIHRADRLPSQHYLRNIAAACRFRSAARVHPRGLTLEQRVALRGVGPSNCRNSNCKREKTENSRAIAICATTVSISVSERGVGPSNCRNSNCKREKAENSRAIAICATTVSFRGHRTGERI